MPRTPRCAAPYRQRGCPNSRSWDFSNVHAKGAFRRAGTRLPRAWPAPVPILLLIIGCSLQAAYAAVDMAAKVSVELVARAKSADGKIQDFPVRDGSVLRTGDGLQLRLESETEAYVYVIAYGSSNTAVLLRPFSGRSDDALMKKGQRVVFPKSGDFLPLDGREGRETLFTIGSDVPLTGIPELLARIESHGDNVTAISAMLGDEFPLSRRLSFKHIGARPLVGVDAATARASVSQDLPAAGGGQPAVAGESPEPAASAGWSLPSSGGFAGDATGAAASAATAAATPGASTGSAASVAAEKPRTDGPATTASAADAAGSVSPALRKARDAAGIDEQQFRGILANLPASGDANVPEGMRKPFKEEGVLGAEGSRIRALERAEAESGGGWPGSQDGSRENIQN